MAFTHPIVCRRMAVILAAFAALFPHGLAAQSTGATAHARARTALIIDSVRTELERAHSDSFASYRANVSRGKRVLDFLDSTLTPAAIEHAPSRELLDSVRTDVFAISRHDLELSMKARGISRAAASRELLKMDTRSLEAVLGGSTKAAALPASLVGLPTDATLIVGVANFFVTRAKDELVFAYLDRLKRSFTDATHGPLLAAVLPDTRVVIDNLGQTEAGAMLPALQASLRADADRVPEHLSRFVATKAPTPRARSFAEVSGLALASLRDIRAGTHPIEALARLKTLGDSDIADPRLRYGLRFGGALAVEYETGRDTLVQFAAQSAARRLLAGFVLHDAFAELPSADTASFHEWLGGFRREYDTRVSPFLQSVQDAQKAVAAARDRIVDTLPRLEQRAAYIAAYRAYLRPAELAFSFAGTQQAFRDTLVRVSTLALDVTDAISERQYNRALILTLSGLREYGHVRPLDATTFRYLTFAATIAEARSDTAVTAALNAAALPVGSYRSKRGTDEDQHVKVGVTLNGYVGAGGGYEHVEGGVSHASAGQLGLALPVGFELAFGGAPYRKGRRLPSVAVFIPVVDLGTIASARFAPSDTVVETPSPTWSQVFAPGVFLMFGLSDHPIAFGAGWQMTRSTREDRQTGRRLDAQRVSALLAVDVPVFRF